MQCQSHILNWPPIIWSNLAFPTHYLMSQIFIHTLCGWFHMKLKWHIILPFLPGFIDPTANIIKHWGSSELTNSCTVVPNTVYSSLSAVPQNEDDVFQRSVMSWGDSRARFLICRSCCSVGRRCQMEGRHDEVKTSPSHFSSAVSNPHEVDGLSQILPVSDICYGTKVDGP